jgi:NADPH:quinone reductase-like Zn-dependent oxidoreductase
LFQIKGVSYKAKTTGIAGMSAVGTITAVNGSSSKFAVNDTVFITGNGLWAEEVSVSQSAAAVVKVKKFT